jgi:hypothetical protein
LARGLSQRQLLPTYWLANRPIGQVAPAISSSALPARRDGAWSKRSSTNGIVRLPHTRTYVTSSSVRKRTAAPFRMPRDSQTTNKRTPFFMRKRLAQYRRTTTVVQVG